MARLVAAVLATLYLLARAACAAPAETATVAPAPAVTDSSSSSSSFGGTVTFSNKNRFLFDVNGNQIDAYAAKINFFNNKYYLYGISFAGEIPGGGPLKAWSSVDLVNWTYEGNLGTVNGGRPHIVFNAASNLYVLWVNVDGGYQVATSPSPTGPFTATGTAVIDLPAGLIGADHAVESFGNNGYLAYSQLNLADPRAGSLYPPIFQTMHISPLTSDFKSTTGVSYNVTSAALDNVDQQTESPDIFVRGNTFYIATSNTCGFCNGSIGLVYRANSIQGPWQRDIVSDYSCGGQLEGILPLTDSRTGQVSYVWHATAVPGGPRVGLSGHIFQPLVFNSDGSVKPLNCAADATFTVKYTPVIGAVATGKATSATDGSPRLADYRAVCDTDLFYSVYQTWTNSKTGTLKEVAVNIAAGSNANPLQINVFKFSNVSDLVSFGYKYTLLGSATFTPSQLTEVFSNASVFLNAPVTKGDKLGFSISEVNPIFPGFTFSIGNYVPYCHLEYTSNSAAMTLLEQPSGQNSLRGLNGKQSPILVRQGRGIKFLSIVA